jgi:hypothetical protein
MDRARGAPGGGYAEERTNPNLCLSMPSIRGLNSSSSGSVRRHAPVQPRLIPDVLYGCRLPAVPGWESCGNDV